MASPSASSAILIGRPTCNLLPLACFRARLEARTQYAIRSRRSKGAEHEPTIATAGASLCRRRGRSGRSSNALSGRPLGGDADAGLRAGFLGDMGTGGPTAISPPPQWVRYVAAHHS